MDLNELLGIIPDIENEIYQDQLFHLSKGIIVETDKSFSQGTDLSSRLLNENFLKLYMISIRDWIRREQFSPIFQDDLISIRAVPNGFELRLVAKGNRRKLMEKEYLELSQHTIKKRCESIISQTLKSITIESFIQFKYIDFFNYIKINDNFFNSINESNISDKEDEFNFRVEQISNNKSFILDFNDIFYYFKPYFFDSISKQIKISEYTIPLNNNWKNKENMVIRCD